MYMQRVGVITLALSAAAAPVLAQGLTGDQGGGRTSLAASGVAPARRCQSVVIEFAVGPGHEQPAAVLLDQRGSMRSNAPSAVNTVRW